MRSEVVGLSGGKKQFWLRLNRTEVETYYFEHGAEATMSEFNMSQVTLQGFFERKSREVKLTRLSENDRWVYRTCMEASREVKRRVAELESWRVEVEPVIEFGRGIVKTLGQIQGRSQNLPSETKAITRGDFRGKSKI